MPYHGRHRRSIRLTQRGENTLWGLAAGALVALLYVGIPLYVW
jgi:tetrahydromethanopterin S-methyltransferase subunit F